MVLDTVPCTSHSDTNVGDDELEPAVYCSPMLFQSQITLSRLVVVIYRIRVLEIFGHNIWSGNILTFEVSVFIRKLCNVGFTWDGRSYILRSNECQNFGPETVFVAKCK